MKQTIVIGFYLLLKSKDCLRNLIYLFQQTSGVFKFVLITITAVMERNIENISIQREQIKIVGTIASEIRLLTFKRRNMPRFGT